MAQLLRYPALCCGLFRFKKPVEQHFSLSDIREKMESGTGNARNAKIGGVFLW